MKGGHNRLPGAVKKLRGTTDARTMRKKRALVPPKLVPPPPRGLSRVEQRVWRELAPQVEHLGVFGVSDFTAFRQLVETVAETRTPEFKKEKGTARVRMRQVASTLLQNFGLTPASRDRVNVQPPARPLEQEADPAAQTEVPVKTPLFLPRVVPKAVGG